MSLKSSYYVIFGYDLTGYETDKFNYWRWTEEGEDYFDYQCRGNIQFFDDPMSNSYLYFGYVFANGDEYEFNTATFTINDILYNIKYVDYKLKILQDSGIISREFKFDVQPKIMAFEECS